MKKFIVNMWNEKKGVVIGVIIGLVVVISAVTIFVVDSSVKKQAKSDVLADKSEVISQTETVAKDEKSVTTSNNQTTTENETTKSVATVQETQEDSSNNDTTTTNVTASELREQILNDKDNFSDFWYKVEDVFQLSGNEGIVTVGYVQGTVTVGTNVIIVNPDNTTVVSTITGMERFVNGSSQQDVTAKDEYMAFKLSLIPDKSQVQKEAIIRQSGKKE